MFRLHRLDVLPVDDLGIRAGIRQVYSLVSCCAFNLHFEAAEGQRGRGAEERVCRFYLKDDNATCRRDSLELPKKKTVEDLGRMWKPYRTIACWYLWRSLEVEKIPTEIKKSVDRKLFGLLILEL